jgi:hypothetical protein
MFWGGISHGLKSPLIVIAGKLTGVRYRDEIFRPVAVPFVQQQHLIFQQDNARPHVARVYQDFLANHNINPLAWPPYSPDLSPIERTNGTATGRRISSLYLTPVKLPAITINRDFNP